MVQSLNILDTELSLFCGTDILASIWSLIKLEQTWSNWSWKRWSWQSWHGLDIHDMFWKTWHGHENMTWSRKHDMALKKLHGLDKHDLVMVLISFWIYLISTHGLRLTLNLVCTRPSLYQCNKSLYQNC